MPPVISISYPLFWATSYEYFPPLGIIFTPVHLWHPSLLYLFLPTSTSPSYISSPHFSSFYIWPSTLSCLASCHFLLLIPFSFLSLSSPPTDIYHQPPPPLNIVHLYTTSLSLTCHSLLSLDVTSHPSQAIVSIPLYSHSCNLEVCSNILLHPFLSFSPSYMIHPYIFLHHSSASQHLNKDPPFHCSWGDLCCFVLQVTRWFHCHWCNQKNPQTTQYIQ